MVSTRRPSSLSMRVTHERAGSPSSRTVQIGHIVIVVLEPGLEHNVEVAAVEAGLGDAADLHLVSLDRQAIERRAKNLFPRAEVEQGGTGHIAAHTARAIQIQGLSHNLSPRMSTRNDAPSPSRDFVPISKRSFPANG